MPTQNTRPKIPHELDALKPSQRAFALEYAASGNATQAARTAGYRGNEATLNVTGSRLLRNAKVAKAIKALTQPAIEKAVVHVDRVMQELAYVGLSDIGEVLDFSGNSVSLKKPSEIPEAARRAISSVKVKRYMEGPGDNAQEVEVTEFKFWDKNGALKMLGDRHGAFKAANPDPPPSISVHLDSKLTPDEARDVLGSLLAKPKR